MMLIMSIPRVSRTNQVLDTLSPCSCRQRRDCVTHVPARTLERSSARQVRDTSDTRLEPFYLSYFREGFSMISEIWLKFK
jgi:hypothetical protein